MLTLTVATGGQWVIPVLVLIFLTIALYQYANKKQMTGLMKFFRGLEYVVFLLILVLVWIIYVKGRTSLINASTISVIAVETIGNRFMDSHRDALKVKYSKNYSWIRFSFDLIILSIFSIILLIQFKFSIIAWIIVILVIGISTWIDFAWRNYK